VRSSGRRVAFGAVALLFGAASVRAQQLEPRAYAPSPVDVNIVGMPLLYQFGNVVTDPSLPIQNVDAKVGAAAVFYNRTFTFLGRSASALVAMPWVWAKVSGDVGEDRRSISRSGQGDLQLRLASNIFGGPALTPQEFAQAAPRTTLGASLSVVAPAGQYDPTKLINIGNNRWAFKPELGFVQPVGKWSFEAYAGVWLFTVNPDFFGGNRLTQDPIAALQAHVVYTFQPGLWLSVDGTWYSGGATQLNGAPQNERQDNTRIGATLAIPLGRHQLLKAAWAKGASVRVGQDFTTIGVTYQYRWF
jgi:hypothetical protein